MSQDSELPLDISEFKCIAVSTAGVVVVFEQTSRRYVFGWRDGELGLAEPDIDGQCAPHAPEVIDCLARAVAYQAVRAVPATVSSRPRARTLTEQLRGFLSTRG